MEAPSSCAWKNVPQHTFSWSPQWACAPLPLATGHCLFPGSAGVPGGVLLCEGCPFQDFLANECCVEQGVVGEKFSEVPHVQEREVFVCCVISLKHPFQLLCLDLLMVHLVWDQGFMSEFDSFPVLSNSDMLGACFSASKRRNTLGNSGRKKPNQTTYKNLTTDNCTDKHLQNKFVRVELEGWLPHLRRTCWSCHHTRIGEPLLVFWLLGLRTFAALGTRWFWQHRKGQDLPNRFCR